MSRLLKTLYFHILSLDFVAILPDGSTRESVRTDCWSQVEMSQVDKSVKSVVGVSGSDGG